MKITTVFELNEQYLKLVIAKLQGKNAKLVDCRIEQIKSFNDEQITSLAAQVLRKIKFKTRTVAISLPRNLVTVRNLHLPSQDQAEITRMIELSIGRIVPYKKEETVFDYRLLGKDEMGYTKAILAVVHITAIRRQIKILESAGLFVDKLALSSYGIWQWALNACCSQILPADLYLLVDVDATFTDFIIFSQAQLMFSRSINVGCDDIRENEATNIAKLIAELKQSLMIFYKEEINKKPAKVFIGGAKNIGNLQGALESDLGIPVKAVTPPDFGAENVSITAAAELALTDTDKRIYFTLPEIQIRKSLREKTKDLIILGSFIIYLFMAICAMFLGRIYNQQNYLKKLNQRCGLIDKELSGLVTQLNRIDFIKSYLYENRIPLFVIEQLQNSIPEEIAIDFLKLDEKKVILRGQAQQSSDIFKLVTVLEESEYFENVQTKYTRKKKLGEKEITDFEINFNLALTLSTLSTS